MHKFPPKGLSPGICSRSVHCDDTNLSYIYAQSQVRRAIDYGIASFPLNMRRLTVDENISTFLTHTNAPGAHNMANNSATGVPIVRGAASSMISG